MVPADYDPITLNHWLWWKVRCYEASGEEFQRMFEAVIKRVDSRFTSIRPYGNIGDRKCDGLLFDDGVVFQVYSPDELKQAEVEAKIQEDLEGASKHWGDAGLQKWVFVYNVRRGLPPDIPRTLKAEQLKYPNVQLDLLSSDQLWEMLRTLPLQVRCEVLGPPNGYGHVFMATADGAEAAELLRKGRFALIHDVLSPIDPHAVVEALLPDVLFGPPIMIRPVVTDDNWEAAAVAQETMITALLERSRHLAPRFSVFGLSPIPLLVHLGFVLSDRVEVEPRQFDRVNKTWRWPELAASKVDTGISVEGLPGEPRREVEEIVIRVALSAPVTPDQTAPFSSNAHVQIDITVQNPNVGWLQSPLQLKALRVKFGEVLASIRQYAVNCKKIHLFYAGPAGGAVVLGQAVNPRMDPPVLTYEYARQRTPSYRPAILLQERT